MAKYRTKPYYIDAERWYKNGDHSKDDCHVITGKEGTCFMSEGKIVRYYRNPDVDGFNTCKLCDHKMYEHGWLDREEGGCTVCPGDWIVTDSEGEMWVYSNVVFESMYELVGPAQQQQEVGQH